MGIFHSIYIYQMKKQISESACSKNERGGRQRETICWLRTDGDGLSVEWLVYINEYSELSDLISSKFAGLLKDLYYNFFFL